MSHTDPSLVTVRALADHPLVGNGPTSSLRMVAPGSVTNGRYGLVEYRVAPHSPGAAPHFHQTFSESFYVLSGSSPSTTRGRGSRSGRATSRSCTRAGRTASATTATTRPPS